MKPAPQRLVEPDIIDPWPTVLRLAVVATVTCAVTAGAMWVYVADVASGAAQPIVLLAAATATLSAGAGVYLAVRHPPTDGHQIAMCGMHCVRAGVSIAAGAAAFAVVGRWADAAFRSTPGYALLWCLCAGLPLVISGHAVGYAAIGVLRRGARDPASGATILQRAVLAVAATLGLIVAPAIETIGSFAALASASLGMLTFGGLLVIYDPGAIQQVSRWRVAGVFLIVFAMSGLMPLTGRMWLTDRQQRRRPALETWWGAYALSADDQMELLFNEDEGRGASGGAGPRQPAFAWAPQAWGRRIGVMHHLPPAADSNGRRPALYATGVAAVDVHHLRAARDRYDALVLAWHELPPRLIERMIARGSLDRARCCTNSDGMLLALLPESAGAALEAAFADALSEHASEHRILRAATVMHGQRRTALIHGPCHLTDTFFATASNDALPSALARRGSDNLTAESTAFHPTRPEARLLKPAGP